MNIVLKLIIVSSFFHIGGCAGDEYIDYNQSLDFIESRSYKSNEVLLGKLSIDEKKMLIWTQNAIGVVNSTELFTFSINQLHSLDGDERIIKVRYSKDINLNTTFWISTNQRIYNLKDDVLQEFTLCPSDNFHEAINGKLYYYALSGKIMSTCDTKTGLIENDILSDNSFDGLVSKMAYKHGFLYIQFNNNMDATYGKKGVFKLNPQDLSTEVICNECYFINVFSDNLFLVTEKLDLNMVSQKGTTSIVKSSDLPFAYDWIGIASEDFLMFDGSGPEFYNLNSKVRYQVYLGEQEYYSIYMYHAVGNEVYIGTDKTLYKFKY